MKTRFLSLALALASCATIGTLCACTPSNPLEKSHTGEINPTQFTETVNTGFSSDYLYGNDLKTLREQSDVVVEGTIKELTYVTEGSLAFTIADIEVESQLKGEEALGKDSHISVLYSGGYIPLRDAISADETILETYSDWPEYKIDATVIYQKAIDEKAPSIGDHAVYFLMKETKFPQWGTNLYALLCGTNAELISEDDGATFEYKKMGSSRAARSYTTEVIEKALNSGVSFEKVQRQINSTEK